MMISKIESAVTLKRSIPVWLKVFTGIFFSILFFICFCLEEQFSFSFVDIVDRMSESRDFSLILSDYLSTYKKLYHVYSVRY